MSMIKGQEKKLIFPVYDLSGQYASAGQVVSSKVSIDGLAFLNTSNTVEEIGEGFYSITLTAEEMNADTIVVKIYGDNIVDNSVIVETSDFSENLIASGYVIVGQGKGSTHYTNSVDLGLNKAKKDILVKAYLITNDVADFSQIKGMDVTDINGVFDLWLNPGSYVLSFERDSVGIYTVEITIGA